LTIGKKDTLQNHYKSASINISAWLALCLLMLPILAECQQTAMQDTSVSLASANFTKQRSLRITTMTYRSMERLFTKVNKKLSVINGSRGSATFGH